jgi:type IV fimbrial biogenesis protein FimT
MSKETGYTLIELMVTIAIVAILASIAIPNFFSYLPKHRLKNAALEIQSTIQKARMEAIKGNTAVVLTFDPGSDSYLVFLDNGAGANAGNGVQDAGERTLRSGQMDASIDMTATTFGGNTFNFNARGTAVTTGKITLKNNQNQIKEVSVTLGGISRIL